MSERGYYVQHVAYIGPSFCCLRKNLWLKSKFFENKGLFKKNNNYEAQTKTS